MQNTTGGGGCKNFECNKGIIVNLINTLEQETNFFLSFFILTSVKE